MVHGALPPRLQQKPRRAGIKKQGSPMLIEDPLLQSQNECRAGTCPKPVQELPTLYKLVPLYRLPLTRTARRGRRALRPWDAPLRRARRLGAPVQELPIAYRLVYAGCLPLRGRRGHVPALQGLFRLSWCVFRVRIARRSAPWQSCAETINCLYTPSPREIRRFPIIPVRHTAPLFICQ